MICRIKSTHSLFFSRICYDITLHWQRFTISYLTGKRLPTAHELQIQRLFDWDDPDIIGLFSMFPGFIVVYCSRGLAIWYYSEGCLYLYRLLSLRVRIDLFSLSFYNVLGIVRGSVGLWSYYYITQEKTYRRFIQLLISFLLRMVSLIFLSNLYITLIGWDGLGLTSFLLVIYYKNRKSLGSGIVTGLTNRLGDGLLICVLGLTFMSGAHALMLILLVFLSLTKSAQFPFSSWLPSAIAAPTPVRALVHSSTLVTAGVYVLIRYCQNDPFPLLFLGSFTLFLAGIRACAERDLKKVVALSTLSQLGVMIVSLGALAKSHCFFHLLSHAFFKSLLFVCIGTCIHSVYGTQESRRYNRLHLTYNLTSFTAVSSLSLLGFLFTSGCYSKEIILEALYITGIMAWTLLIFLLGIGLTTLYSMKMLLSSFLVGSFSGIRAGSLGGYRWQVKRPLYLLGRMRVAFGSNVSDYCRPVSAPTATPEKIIPFLMIAVGLVGGFFLANLNSPLLGSLASLTPNVQYVASYSSINDLQKPIDKGWIEAGFLRMSSMSASIYTQYTPILRLGLSALFLWVLYLYV